MSDTIIIRADGNARIGTGHVMRCLALAHGWRRTGGEAHFVCAEITPTLESRLTADGFPVHRLSATPGTTEDAQQTIAVALRSPLSALRFLVADGYQFDAAYQRAIKNAGLRLLLFDDYGHATHYCADFVLNQNLSARAEWYTNRDPATRLLLGTKYVLLRHQFLACRDWPREIPAVARKVLVTLGGGDPDNVTGKVIAALRGLDVEAKIVVGGSNPHLDELRSQVSGFSLLIDVSNMPELMAWADVAIAAGGTTSWELAFMGLPSLVIVIADNQVDIATVLERESVSVNLGPYANLTGENIRTALESLLSEVAKREEMSRRGRRLVDGRGVERVITHMRAKHLVLRRARTEDCRMLWEWANDPQVRTAAFSSASIPWENHEKWFDQKLKSAHSAIFIGADESGTPVGQVRFDWNGNGEAEVDVSVRSNERRAGIGSALIRSAADEAFESTPIRTAHAFIKRENFASIRAFEKAGFRHAGPATVQGCETEHLILARQDG